MYEKISSCYDELGWKSYADIAYEIINNILLDNGIVPDSFCDLGCGSGEIIKKLSNFYDDTPFIGIDISENMIKVARKKCSGSENIKFYVDDMRNFKINRRVNTIVSMYDSINHLLTKEDWMKTFNTTYQSLKYGGIFIIDVVPEGALTKYEGTHINETESGTLIRKVSYDKKKKMLISDVTAFAKSNYFGNYRKVKERVAETSFKTIEIASMLKKVGFKHIKMYNGDMKKYSFNFARLEKADRVYIVGLK